MKKLITIFAVLFVTLNIFAVEANFDWDISLDAGTYITPIEQKPYINTEAMYEQDGWWRVGGEAEISIKNWGINEAGIFGKVAVFKKIANIYTEANVGVGFVSDMEKVELKWRPELRLMIDFGDFVLETKAGIVIKDKIEKDNLYLSIGVQKRFFKELQ